MTRPQGGPRLVFRLILGDDIALGPGKVALLQAIADTGSISAAGRAMGMSYKRAWHLVDTMNRCFKTPLVEAVKGGAHGGGAVVTPLGHDVINRYCALEAHARAAVADDFAALAAHLVTSPQRPTLVAPATSCDHACIKEPRHDNPTTATPRPAAETMARRASGRGESARGVSREAGGLRGQFDGAGARAGRPGAPASAAEDSTRPLDATRALATSAGSLTYTEVSERLAFNIIRCLDDLLDAPPESLTITPDWLREQHRHLAGELFPEWAGCFRTTDVQVGAHFPPPAHAVAVRVQDFCLDLAERLRHLSDAASAADLLAWVDWRFQWIHPFRDFNGRVGRILLVTLTYKLDLPPLDPADLKNRDAYFAALRAADAGDLGPLVALWLGRLGRHQT